MRSFFSYPGVGRRVVVRPNVRGPRRNEQAGMALHDEGARPRLSDVAEDHQQLLADGRDVQAW